MSFYHELISETLSARGIHEDPALIECLMRLHPGDDFCRTRTLDGLSRAAFRQDALRCATMVAEDRRGAVELAVTVGYQGLTSRVAMSGGGRG